MKEKASSKRLVFEKTRLECFGCNVTNACHHKLCSHTGLTTSNKYHCQRKIEKKEMLYQFREESHRFYIIQTGSFKIYSISVAGHEKIMGFYFPGDVIGLDSIVDARSNSIACALEASTVCAIDYDALFGFDGLYSTYYSTVLQTLSIQLLEREKHMQLLCKKNADQRLASFFFAMNKASQNQGCLPHTFNLTMCRADIANYLGVATETVSRLFSKFQKQGLICLEHNRVSIKNVNKLYKLLAGSGKSQAAMFSQKNLGKSP